LKLLVLTTALLVALALGFIPTAWAQTDTPGGQRGTNYDPPPPPQPKHDPPPTVDPEAGKPWFELQKLDWSDTATWVKFALFVGSIVLARRAFRQMKEVDVEEDDESAEEP
jgi:hypothetical protein